MIALIAIILYTFRDLAGPILHELRETTPWVVIIISLSSVCYELVEGWITCSFAKHYNPAFTYRMGVESAFFCSFYRVATLGSGAGIAAVYYFNEKGIAISKGTGMYMVEYVLHKLGIAIFSALLFACSYGFMHQHYAEYTWMLAGAYALTFVIALALLLVCCSKRIHGMLLWILDKLNKKGRFRREEAMLREQFLILEDAASELLTDRRFVCSVLGKNLIKFAFWYVIPYFVLADTGLIDPVQAMAVTSLAVMIAAVIPAPAGIGSSEFVITMLFGTIVGAGEAGSTSLLYRFATFALPFAVGAAVVLIRRVRLRKMKKTEKEEVVNENRI